VRELAGGAQYLREGGDGAALLLLLLLLLLLVLLVVLLLAAAERQRARPVGQAGGFLLRCVPGGTGHRRCR